MHDLFFQRYSALKSEEVKRLHQMRPKGHHYREGICAHPEQGGYTAVSPGAATQHQPSSSPLQEHPALSKMPWEGCFPSSPDCVHKAPTASNYQHMLLSSAPFLHGDLAVPCGPAAGYTPPGCAVLCPSVLTGH